MRSLTPNSDFSTLKAGEIILLSGRVFTARDKAHARLLKEAPEFEIKDSVIYHCGPLTKKVNETWQIVSAGPTTSARMNPFTPKLIEKYSIRGIIGKGGVGEDVRKRMKGKCVYFAMTGGCGALAAKSIKVLDVFWLDLGSAEAVWELEIKEMPLVVGIDLSGESLY